MTPVGVLNGNWKGGIYQEWIKDVQASPVPRVTELTPQEEIEQIEAEISGLEKIICGFASRPLIVADAQAQITHLQEQRGQWLAVIYAADQELVNEEATAYAIVRLFPDVEYPPELSEPR